MSKTERGTVVINDHHDSRFVIKQFLVDLAATRNATTTSCGIHVLAEGVCVSIVWKRNDKVQH